MKDHKNPTRRQLLQVLAGLAAAPLLTSCGSIMYPNRRHQREFHGDLDINVVIMDAVGLLFFLVPGIVAFAVDFYNGAIYYPTGGGEYMYEKNIFDVSNRPDPRTLRLIIEEKIREGADIELDMRCDNLEIVELRSLDEFEAVLARYQMPKLLASN